MNKYYNTGVKMDFLALVGLDQHLNGPMDGSFAVVLYLRIECWVIVVLSFRLTQYHANFRAV